MAKAASVPVRSGPAPKHVAQTAPKPHAKAPAAPAANTFLGGMNETELFRSLFGNNPIPQTSGIVGARGTQPNFPPGSPGYLLQKLFGGHAKAQDYINPNDVNFREGGVGGSGAINDAQNLADAANGGPETPQQYFQRMTQMAMGNGGALGAPASFAPAPAPAPIVPKVVKPKLVTAPKTVAPATTYTPPAPTTPAAPVNPFSAADTYKAPEPAAPAEPSTAAPLATGA